MLNENFISGNCGRKIFIKEEQGTNSVITFKMLNAQVKIIWKGRGKKDSEEWFLYHWLTENKKKIILNYSVNYR